ncbi:CD63 antigen-like [Antennarius striatus]|uniref:CD63 antigen-like n=1 Tax=Antennarius striatus TaxID=241820 RepID=UPI0035B2A1BA
MGLNWGVKCLKYLMSFFNLLFWICGLVLIVVGVMIQMFMHKTIQIDDALGSAYPILVVAVGVAIFLIAFLGCCGAWKESYCIVAMFAVLLTLISITQFGAVISGYIFRNKVSTLIRDSMEETLSHYENSTEEFKLIVDLTQQNLKCCGVNSSVDWGEFLPEEDTVPDSCCIKETVGCGIGNMTNADIVYQKGCQHAIADYLQSNIMWVIVLVLIIVFLQVMGIILSCMLMKGIRRGSEVVIDVPAGELE